MEKSVKKYWPFFLIPTVGAFVIGFIIPFIEGVYLSFCKFNTIKDAEWVGFKNFIYIFTKEKTGFAAPGGFLDAFLFTGKFTIVSVILINVLAFALALALTKGIKGTNIFRTIFFMPNLIGGVVLGYVWKTLINCFLSIIGQPLLALNSTAGYWGLIILMCWQQIGYMMIVYIAGLQSVPDSVIEAAEIDGANAWKTLFKVKIPMVMSSGTRSPLSHIALMAPIAVTSDMAKTAVSSGILSNNLFIASYPPDIVKYDVTNCLSSSKPYPCSTNASLTPTYLL